MLRMCYQSEVERRNMKYVSDEATLEKIGKSIADDPTYFNKLKTQELLFIDDVGTEPASVKSWGNEFSPVTELIYARYDRQLFTIATSNLADEEFGDRYGERIADRMEEMFERLHYSQKSYRK